MTKLIELTPLADFFFGGEATFGQGQNRHYFVRSNLWPQQTSLLGMLRYELLKSEPIAFDLAKNEVSNEAEATSLIGFNGFDGSRNDAFGIVEGISPVFLLSPEGLPYFLRSRMFLEGMEKTWLEKKPKFQAINLLTEIPKSVSALADSIGYQLMCEKEGEQEAKAYDGKTDFKEMLIGKDSKVPVSEVFIKVNKTGNRKEYDGVSDESGFFKQDFFHLKGGWRFAFIVEFSDDLPKGFGTWRKVQLGAERRLFSLSIGDTTPIFEGIEFKEGSFLHFEKLYPQDPEAINPDLSLVVLLSDAKAEPHINHYADFVSSETIPFRYLNTHLKDPNTLWNQDQAPKSSRYNLLRRGSVFYAKDTQHIENELINAAAFRRIGYNYFKTITVQQI